MAKVWVRLHPDDQPDYERGGEWVETGWPLRDGVPVMWPVGIDDLPWDDHVAIRRELGREWTELQPGGMDWVRLCIWMARRRAGITEPFADFKPRPYGFQVDQEGDESEAAAGDADPPARSPSTSAAASRSKKRSSASTRGSRGSTTSRPRKSAS